MPKLSSIVNKDRFTRQVVKVHQSTTGHDIASYHKVYLYALDGSRIGFCDMLNDENELQYPKQISQQVHPIGVPTKQFKLELRT